MHVGGPAARLTRCQRFAPSCTQLAGLWQRRSAQYPQIRSLCNNAVGGSFSGAEGTASTHALKSRRVQHQRHSAGTQLPQLVGACSIQGRRPYQEDRHIVSYLTPEVTFVACYDGHGGAEAADFAHTHLHKYFKEQVLANEEWEGALRHAFKQVCRRSGPRL